MTARFIVADVFEGLATLEDGSVDLVVTSPPFLALRSYLPADHPNKGKEIGSESTPAEFIDTLLKVTAELRRVLAPHGSICVELGDTYAGGNGQSTWYQMADLPGHGTPKRVNASREGTLDATSSSGPGWPLAKSRTLIPSLYQIALAYGFNPLTGTKSPAGQWRVRNIVTWARPNPPVGALGDKWRPATSDLIVACTSSKRYWDDLATRKPHQQVSVDRALRGRGDNAKDQLAEPAVLSSGQGHGQNSTSGAPLLDYWVIPPTGYSGAHYAVFPPELVEPCVKAMCPQRVCVTCGMPSRRIVEVPPADDVLYEARVGVREQSGPGLSPAPVGGRVDKSVGGWGRSRQVGIGWTDCGHDNWRPSLVLDPFAGSGTTLAVATGHGHDAIGIDLDQRNAELARGRVGPFLFDEVTV